jgi:hypothetical protein
MQVFALARGNPNAPLRLFSQKLPWRPQNNPGPALIARLVEYLIDFF